MGENSIISAFLCYQIQKEPKDGPCAYKSELLRMRCCGSVAYSG